MIRIVGVQRSTQPEKEFILLQNQGSLRVKLRGHFLTADRAFDTGSADEASYAFGDDLLIPPGMFVILFTGSGSPRWARTKEGQMIYYAYMGRESSVWDAVTGPIHILATQHTYAERQSVLLLK